MTFRVDTKAKQGLKIAAVLIVSLIGMALLPLIALPYSNLDWLMYDPAYKGCYGFVPVPSPTPVTVEIPCAELPKPGEPLAARVNGQGIGLQAYERELAQFLDALVALGADPESKEFQAELPAFRRQVLDLLIGDVLVQQAAVEMDITVSEEEIQTRAAETIAEGGGLESFQAWLEETGQSWEEFHRDVCQDLLRQAVLEEVTAGITGTMEMVWARQIVVATEEDAVAALTRLASGEPFDAVAQEVSLDDLTRDLGGDLGWFPSVLGWVQPEVEAAAFAGTPGQVQGPIRVGETYVIVQTIEYRAEHTPDPNEREAIRAASFERWLAARRQAAKIEIFVDLDPVPGLGSSSEMDNP